jgi:hypothetical protein
VQFTVLSDVQLAVAPPQQNEQLPPMQTPVLHARLVAGVANPVHVYPVLDAAQFTEGSTAHESAVAPPQQNEQVSPTQMLLSHVTGGVADPVHV